MRVESVELIRVDLPLVRPFRTAFGTQTTRAIRLLRVVTDLGEGWGETAAHAEPFYNSEFADASDVVLDRWLVPSVLQRSIEPEDLAVILSRVRGYPAAKAGLEIAIYSAAAHAAGVSLATYLGGARTHVDVGVSIGMTSSADQLVEQVAGYLDDGYRRVKLKIEPGWDLVPVTAVRRAFPELLLQVDANASYPREAVSALHALDNLGLLMIEQPFAEDDVRAHADLAATLSTPICLDETITSYRAAEDALEQRACSIVNIKAGRVGGLHEAIRIHDLCQDRQTPVWCGGMLESGVGRAANVALASLPGFTLPGDISASSRYFTRDLTEPFTLTESRLQVPIAAGLGVAVDEQFLDDLGASRQPLGLA